MKRIVLSLAFFLLIANHRVDCSQKCALSERTPTGYF